MSAAPAYLELQAIWSDEHMVQFQAAFSNGRLEGQASGYSTFHSLKEFGEKLADYSGVGELEPLEMEGVDDVAFRVQALDSLGHFALTFEACLARNPEEKIICPVRLSTSQVNDLGVALARYGSAADLSAVLRHTFGRDENV